MPARIVTSGDACIPNAPAQRSLASTPTSWKSRSDVGSGQPGDFNIGGLPDIGLKESHERIKAALKNCGHDFLPQSVTVSLAPADIRKESSAFDLPMALSILGCKGTFFGKRLDQYISLGELSLEGQV